MQSSGLTSTPFTLALLLTLTTLSILTTLTSTKHLLPLRPIPALYPHLRLHALLTHQLAYTSSTDLLFACVLLYHLRVLERLFGTRKFVSFVLVCGVWVGVVVTPVVLVGVGGLVRLLMGGNWGGGWYIPAGCTGCIMAALAVWGEEVPRLWRYTIVLSSSSAGSRRPSERGRTTSSSSSSSPRIARRKEEAEAEEDWTLTLSNKSPTYLLALQLALTQFPYTLLPATIGYIIGLAYAGDFLPGRMSAWRVPRWMVGQAPISIPILRGTNRRKEGRGGGGGGSVETERYEGLRRRLEEEGGRNGDGDGMRQAAHASGGQRQGGGGGEDGGRRRRRPMGAQIADYFRGVF